MFGLCECGCEGKAPISNRRDRRFGYEKGQSKRYIKGHQPKANRRSEIDFIPEDRGYKTACWIWQLASDKDGYGAKKHKRKSIKAHRFYYEKKFGPIPEGLVLDHLCRVRSCVNPDHCEPVTNTVNIRRGVGAKIDENDAQAIREMSANGALQRQIAEVFGLSRAYVSTIISGRKVWL
jgi:hypothetical protein